MRQRFEQQLQFGTVPINEVVFRPKDRHQLQRCLKGLQYIFVNQELSEKIFIILEEKILKGKKATGRNGMSLWEVLVLGCVRMNLNIDYDFLVDQANNHRQFREILGVARTDFKEGKQYRLQTVIDNVQLLDVETIDSINQTVVEASHEIVKKNWLSNHKLR